MMRFAITLAASLMLAAPSAAEPVTIRWHGQSFFEIVTPKGTRIVIDPHAIEVYGRKMVQADLILMTHLHTDHTQVEVVEDHEKVKKLNALKEVDRFGRKDVDWNIVEEKFRDVDLKTIGVFHDNLEGMKRGKNGVWIIEVAGLRIVHLGDLGHRLTDAQVEKLGKVDVLMIPIGGVYTINGLVAADVVDQVKPQRMIIPMHYGNETYTDLLDASYFLDEMPKESVKKSETNQVVVDSANPVPKSPTIQLMDWKSKIEE